ncbi:MAG: YybH family protein [Burkholderiales bacterium]
MRGLVLILAAATSASLAMGCAQKAPVAPAVDLAAEAQAVRDRSAAWQKLAHAKDAASIVNDIRSADSFTLDDGKILKGVAALQADLQAGYDAAPDGTIDWTTNDVKVAASGDLAYELGVFTYDPDGAGTKPAVSGEYVTVWSKIDGTWRAVVDAGTVLEPAVAPAQ